MYKDEMVPLLMEEKDEIAPCWAGQNYGLKIGPMNKGRMDIKKLKRIKKN